MLVSCAVALSALALQGGASAGTAPRFDKPVRLTTDANFGGYEPSIVVDRFNNVVVTAHKSNHGLALSPDSRATVPVRSQSWLWSSKDGKTFVDLPGSTPVQEQNFEFGVEGDLARDDTGHIYFVDTSVVDNSFSRYKSTGPGKIALQATRPVLLSAEPLDDRPWIAAHGDGVVLYIGNGGNDVYPGGTLRGGQASGPGRFTVHMSYNHGDTFDSIGYTLDDSGWCRPAADHRKGSRDLYVLCSNDRDTLWAYSSHDDGRTWVRTRMGSYRDDDLTTYPSVAIDSKGTIYALFNDVTASGGAPIESHLRLYTSTTRGRTWTSREVTPRPGIIRYSWLDVAPNGTLGMGYYYREDRSFPWHLYAGTARPGQRFSVAKVSSIPVAAARSTSPPGDFFQVAFGPDNRLNVAWTSASSELLGLNSDIYYAHQRS